MTRHCEAYISRRRYCSYDAAALVQWTDGLGTARTKRYCTRHTQAMQRLYTTMPQRTVRVEWFAPCTTR